jgi:hypothetical protein
MAQWAKGVPILSYIKNIIRKYARQFKQSKYNHEFQLYNIFVMQNQAILM